MLRANQLDADRAFVLVVDLQEKLLPLIRFRERVVAAGRKLLGAAPVFELPVIATQQYSSGIGSTVPVIAHVLNDSCSPYIVTK